MKMDKNGKKGFRHLLLQCLTTSDVLLSRLTLDRLIIPARLLLLHLVNFFKMNLRVVGGVLIGLLALHVAFQVLKNNFLSFDKNSFSFFGFEDESPKGKCVNLLSCSFLKNGQTLVSFCLFSFYSTSILGTEKL